MFYIILGFLLSFQVQAAEQYSINEVTVEQADEANVSLISVNENYKSGILFFTHEALIPVVVSVAGKSEELVIVKHFRSMTDSSENVKRQAALYIQSIQKEMESKDATSLLVDKYNVDGMDVVEISVESKGFFTKLFDAVSSGLGNIPNKYEGEFVQ